MHSICGFGQINGRPVGHLRMLFSIGVVNILCRCMGRLHKTDDTAAESTAAVSRSVYAVSGTDDLLQVLDGLAAASVLFNGAFAGRQHSGKNAIWIRVLVQCGELVRN